MASRRAVYWVIVFALVAVGRVFLTYKATPQGFDEPCHVAAGIELLDKGRYTLDAVHPPLSRYAIGIGPYLAGERYPTKGPGATSEDYNVVGNSILFDSGHYRRNLALARLGVLPFLLFAIAIVFLWTRREFGDFAGVMAVALFTTLPIVLAFSSIAYTDLAAASTQAAAMFAFVMWIEKKSARSSTVLGVAVGLALLSKFTALLFLPSAAVGMWITKWICNRKGTSPRGLDFGRTARHLAIVLFIAVTILWSGYGFSIGRVRESMQLSLASIPSFHNFPAPLRGLARRLVVSDPVIPAPELFRGLASLWVLNHGAPNSYLLGKVKRGGWWYFFLVGIVVKTPIAFLTLVLVGLYGLWQWGTSRWTALAPLVSAFAIFLATMPAKYNMGVRHVMIVFPLLAIVAGYGCGYLWQQGEKWHPTPAAILLALLVWQCLSSFSARHDYIAYFNSFAGRDPSRVLVLGCDLECGQDVFRLAEVLRQRHISHFNLALWSSADMSQMGLPDFSVPAPYTPVHGWLAVGMRSLRFGNVLHTGNPPDAYSWINKYEPVQKIGNTIRLYYIPVN